MGGFDSMMDILRGSGFDNFVLPWILFLVIIYSIVMKAPFLNANEEVKKQKKQISVIIAAILSFFIVNYQMTDGRLIGEALTGLFGSMSLYLAGILVIILFLGMGGWKMDDIPGGKTLWVVILVLIAIMLFFNTGMAEYFNISDETATWLFMFLLVGGALYYLGQDTATKKKGETPTEQSVVV